MVEWFAKALQKEIKVRRLRSQAELARLVDKPTATISRWIRGVQLPAFTDLCEVAEKLQWRMDWVNEPGKFEIVVNEPPATIRVYGRVSAGLVTLAQQEERVIEGDDGAWKSSVYRKLSHGPIIYLEVSGNSMEPEYPDGALLACAKPSQQSLPDLTPVIARVDDSATFKLYRLTADRRRHPEVELIPINRSFDVQRYHPRDVTIDYVVLGFVNPWKHGVTSEPRVPILRDSR